ncbi:MAG: phosphotransferase [Planctomycetaceae bacterium]|nr:phosphotransferase [Planctomycetaceae bacterium]
MPPTDRQRILKQWPAFFAQARLIDSHAGFSGAIIERLEIAGEQFALRGWPPESLSVERLEGLHQFQKFLFDRWITQVSVPVPASDGRTIVAGENRCWQLEPWMPGEASFLDEPNDAKLKSAMQLLARVHLVAEQFKPPDRAAQWFSVTPAATSPAVIDRVRILDQWSDTNPDTVLRLIQNKPLPESIKEALREIVELFQTRAHTVQAELHEQLSHQYRLVPCLRDLWSDHVLFTENEVTGLIDFGACRAENPMIDLSRLLGSYYIDDPASYRRAMEWYGEIRSLSSAERNLFVALDLSQRLLAGMAWIERLVFEGKRLADWGTVSDRLSEIIPRMQAIRISLI